MVIFLSFFQTQLPKKIYFLNFSLKIYVIINKNP